MVKRIGSPAQERARAAFKAGVAFLVPINGLLKKGWADRARRKKSLPVSLALGHVLHTAIKLVDGQPQVDPSKVLLSEGTLAPVRLDQINRYPDRIEVLHHWFRPDFIAGDDSLILCAYQVDKGYAFVNGQLWKRQEGRVIVPIPDGFQADGLYLYLMITDRNGHKFGRSQYLGYSTI